MITVRPEREEDHADIQKVRDAATATLRLIYRPGQRAIDNKERIRANLQRIVAVTDGRVVGTVQYYLANRSVQVIGLGVHTDYRRKGVARSLIRHLGMIGMGAGQAQLKLHTIKETENTEVFKRLGFTVIAEREDDLFESDKYEKLTDVEMVMALPAHDVSI